MKNSAPDTRRRKAASAETRRGLITAAYGRRYRVELDGGALLDCVTRGKTRDVACGDRVAVRATGPGQGVIEETEPRTSLFYRSDPYREKFFAANVTQIIIVVAPVPSVHRELLDRCLVAAEHEGIASLIALNKSDLPGHAAASAALADYRALGYRVVSLSAKRDVDVLRPYLKGNVSVLVGQSGMGKSTIINRLVPDAAARVGALSEALASGRHTTTHAELYHLEPGADVIDSPGMQEFGLSHIEPRDIAAGYLEFRPLLGQCRFRDCLHLQEPGCEITAACAAGRVSAQRVESYRRLVDERLRQAKLTAY
ncbi:MAG: ribosome small subunit-dependent GTPase A [Rhodospirillaceae bacterium]